MMWLKALNLMMLSAVIQSVQAEEWAPAEAAPSLELLEHLGSLVEDGDDLIGPELFIETSIIRDDREMPHAIDEEVGHD